MAIEVVRAGTDDYGSTIKALIVGSTGAGKTRMSSCWPDPLFLDAEGGLMSIADRQTPNIKIKNSKQILEIIELLQKDKTVYENTLGVPVQTVVVDTVDEVARLLVRERMLSERKETMAIQDWGWLGEQLRQIIRALRNLDLNVVFLVHGKMQEDSATGRSFVKPGIQGAMGDEIAGYVDLAVLIQAKPVVKVVNGQSVREIQRFLQTYPDPMHDWIKDRSGKLPQEFPINFNDDYTRLEKLIFGAARQQKIDDLKGDLQEITKDAPKLTPPRKAAVAPVPEPVVESTPDPEPEPTPVVAETPVETVVQLEAGERHPDGTYAETPNAVAADCPKGYGCVLDKDMGDLSYIRFRQRLCRSCFAEKKAAK